MINRNLHQAGTLFAIVCTLFLGGCKKLPEPIAAVDREFAAHIAAICGTNEKQVILEDGGEVFIFYARIKIGSTDPQLIKSILNDSSLSFVNFNGASSYWAGGHQPRISWWDAQSNPTFLYTGKLSNKGNLTATTANVNNEFILYIYAVWFKTHMPN